MPQRSVQPALDDPLGFAAASARPEQTSRAASPALKEAAKSHSSYRHEALFYRNQDEFLAGTVPFIQQGAELGEPVMVAVIEPKARLLRAALGDAAGDVRFVDMAELGRNPARIIPHWLRFIAEHCGSGQPRVAMRGIGEPIWPGRRPQEVVECQLHEALLNLAVDPDQALWLRCPYDESALEPEWLQEARRSHPLLVEGADYRGSTLYGGVHHVDSVFRSELPPAPSGCYQLPLVPADLPRVPELLGPLATVAGLDGARTRALAGALVQVAGDAVRSGRGKRVRPATLRIWSASGAVGCEVTDSGWIEDRLVGRRNLDEQGPDRRGIWQANQVCDLVQVRSTSAGCTVRLWMWL